MMALGILPAPTRAAGPVRPPMPGRTARGGARYRRRNESYAFAPFAIERSSLGPSYVRDDRQGAPKVELACARSGELQLEGMSVEAMQIMTLPRTLDSGEPPDEGPAERLRDVFHRVRAALVAWSESLDHLKNGRSAGPKADD